MHELIFESPYGLKLMRNEALDYYYVQQGAEPGFAGSAVLAVDSDRNALLIRSRRPPVDGIALEVPRGGSERGETALQCASRELGEETGLWLSEGCFLDLGFFHPDNAVLASRVGLFLAFSERPFHTLPLQSDPDEVISLEILPIEILIAAIQDGTIMDGATLSLTAKAVLGGHLVP